MYYIVYGFFYLLSLLPWWFIYLLSDAVYGLLYYVMGYRKDIVMKNLSIAFPEKNEAERKAIAKQFYKNFTDTFLEMIKFFSISKEEVQKRFVVNFEVINDLYASGQSVQLHAGHFFNWELGNLSASVNSKYRLLGAYTTISNKTFDRLMKKMRQRFGTIMISSATFKTEFLKYSHEPYLLGLVADQNAKANNAYWTNFFGKPVPFVKGPEKGAKKLNTAVVMAHYYKLKRGHYKADLSLLTTTPRELADGEITKQLINFIEESVRKQPANYLWTHKRWKHQYDAEKHGSMFI